MTFLKIIIRDEAICTMNRARRTKCWLNNVDRLVDRFYLRYRPSNAIKLNRRKFSRRSWPAAKIRCQCCRQRHFAVPLEHSVKAKLELAVNFRTLFALL